jgi:hypothetical protein
MKSVFIIALMLLTSMALAFTDTVTKEFTVSEGGTLTLESDLGSIDVK